MIRSISQQQIQNINNPNAQAFAGLNQTLQHVGQVNRQSRLDRMNQQQFKSQYMKENAPFIAEVINQATPDEAGLEFVKSKLNPIVGDDFDLDDLTVDRQKVLSSLSTFIGQNKQNKPFAAVNENNENVFVRDTANGLQQVKGFAPPKKSSLVSIGGEEKEEDKAFGKFLVKNFGDINARATASEDNIQQLQLAKNIDVTTGKLEPLKAWGGSIIQGLGLDPNSFGLNNATNAESFNAIMGNVLATKLAAQKGPQTDRDADRMMKTLATLGNTPEAKEFMLNSAIAIANRQVEQRDFYADHKNNTGSLKGADKAWKAFIRKTPIFGKNPNSGRPVFFNEFKSVMFDANDNITDEQVLKLWREKYRGR